MHHFLAKADWSVEARRAVRLELTRQALRERPFLRCSDETGDRKKGKTTDDAASQDIGTVHTLANGVVAVNAYGVRDRVTCPLAFRLFKPRRRLQPGDVYKSKPPLAGELLQELAAQGFRFSLVLADRLYGASDDFISARHRLGVPEVVAIRSHHTVGTFPGARVRQTRWRPCARVFTAGTTERRFIGACVFGQRTPTRSYVVTTDPVHLPPETTWHLMTTRPGKIARSVGNTCGLRPWIA